MYCLLPTRYERIQSSTAPPNPNDTSTLRYLLDKHLPIRKVRKRIEPLTPWFDSDCIKAKRNKCRLERAYHRTELVVDRVWWTKAIQDMHALFSSKEHAYWEAKVAAAASNSKKRWQILNKLMCKDVKRQIPDSATADAFSKFFPQKVESVRSATENAAPPSFSPCPEPLAMPLRYISALDERAGFDFDFDQEST